MTQRIIPSSGLAMKFKMSAITPASAAASATPAVEGLFILHPSFPDLKALSVYCARRKTTFMVSGGAQTYYSDYSQSQGAERDASSVPVMLKGTLLDQVTVQWSYEWTPVAGPLSPHAITPDYGTPRVIIQADRVTVEPPLPSTYVTPPAGYSRYGQYGARCYISGGAFLYVESWQWPAGTLVITAGIPGLGFADTVTITFV